MSSLYSKIINQKSAIKQLELIFAASVKPTSLIFSGKKGIGKEAVAHAFTQSLNCEKGGFYPCGTCSSCIAVENCDTRYINFLYPLPEAKNEKNLDDIYEVFDDEINKKIQDLLKKKKIIPTQN